MIGLRKKSLLSILAIVSAVFGVHYLLHRHRTIERVMYTFVGAPGSGKGTLASQCVAQLGYKVLSTGNLCREAVKEDSPRGRNIREVMQSGKLVPDDIIMEMVDQWLSRELKGGNTIILDGFPRTEQQAHLLHELLQTKYKGIPFKVVYLKISHEEVIRRLSRRLVCQGAECQAIYNADELIDQCCPRCGSSLIRRADDQPEVIAERLKVYDQTALPLLEFYKHAGYAIIELDIEKVTPEEMFLKFKKAIQV